ncbi:hypothetical protein V1264_007256 [Littorina saxatilis]|uniref:Uncharacterized protein n=1 Tax=Littorina saxatilis TaxID=31220 RepID=A0AAN9AUJ5_9CAEN
MVAAKCGSNNSVCTSLSVCNDNTQICECLGGLAPDRIDFTCGPGEGMDCTEENTKCVAGMVCDAAGCSLDAGESCEGKRQSYCKTGTLCDLDNICRLELGQDCNANPGSCKMGYVCDASLTCRIPVGDLCGVSKNCVAGGFCVNSTCSCTEGLTSKVGLICSPQDGLTGGRCTSPANTCIGDDAVCNSIHRRCVCQNGYQMEPHNLQCKKKAGESCETDDECAAGRSCDSVSRQCSLLLGESCFGPLSNNCGTEATCDINYECKLNIDGDCSDERVVLCKQGTFCDWLKKCRLNIGANCSENNECPTGGLCEQQTCQCQQGTATAFEVLCEPETGRVGASCNAVDSPCNLEGTQCLDGVCACTGGLNTTQTFTCFGLGASKATSEANGSTWLVATLVAALGLTVAFVVGFAHLRRQNKKSE